MVLIGASILSADFSNLKEELKKAEEAGVDFFHVDMMDGHFVPNISMGIGIAKHVKKLTSLPVEVHLMVENVDLFINEFKDMDYISFHIEAVKFPFRIINKINEIGAKPIVALNPATPIGRIEYILDEVYGVLVMTVEPGFAGQKFIPIMVKKIRKLKSMIVEGGHDVKIFVDGGINTETAPLAVKAGADAIIAASAIFGKEDIKEAVKALRESVGGENEIDRII
ncbi:ribulose-phosphate 3-epimerase [Methanocaldococcus infernus ME]|uniref:Ribulose-phosphate 3-epimerase n=1 Tax=Methanocaldococcus infernus (strain DSM 11812 / JCM 15783 / ME) TaxID=573063 RepID=D5VQK4_METIM|nr:ribulose-phosphate 3-epimerase [Methanocaldococcus infernus]ADG12857.1 ribulose-phosphate 3-epimerase [Methanocaldococcus infernus ME]